jgi:phage terminase large subunit-like protein
MSGDAHVHALIDRLIALPEAERGIAVRAMTGPMRREFDARWRAWAHGGQLSPPGDWRVWLIRAGRGFGKTRAGSEWVNQLASEMPEGRFALVGATLDEVRRVMIEGKSGLIATARADRRPVWRASARELLFPSGAVAFAYSADSPEGLRGPEHHLAWADELGKWGGGGEAAWDNLAMGLRLGERPRVLVTTTPRATRLMRRVMALPGTVETCGRTRDNPHLPASFVAAMEAEYGGTRLGRQELDGELIEDVAGALWKRGLIEACRGRKPRDVVRVVVGVDPPASAEGDACGIVAVALDAAGVGHVLADASVAGLSPEGWARAVAACAAKHGADKVVAEKNQGGDMVRSVLRAAEVTLPLRLVHASRGKAARAEPVAALYETGRVKHAGRFPALEDELCGLVAGGGYEGPGRSPDRADALVWALSELMLGRKGAAGVRRLG